MLNTALDGGYTDHQIRGIKIHSSLMLFNGAHAAPPETSLNAPQGPDTRHEF